MQRLILALIAGLLPLTLVFPAAGATPQEVKPKPMLITQGIEPSQTRKAIASVAPEQPIQIRVVNQSQLDVNIVAQLLKPPSEEREAAPQNSVRFGTLHTSYLPVPIELEIYFGSSQINMNDLAPTQINLNDLELTVSNNEIIVTVAVKLGEGNNLRVIRVDDQGNIYLF